MNELIVYTLKSAFVLSLLYLPYTLMLRRERFFRLNRMTLVGILVTALLIPICRYKVSVPVEESNSTIVQTQELVYRTETIIVGTEDSAHWDVWEWLTLIYAIGMGCMLCLRIYQLTQIRRIMRQGCLWRQKEDDGVTLYCHAGNEAPFSWMRSIVVSQQDYENNSREILLHERAHIQCHHSFDILLLTLAEVLQWWNPMVYRLGNSLRNVHEYEADDYVLRQGVSLNSYQQLLARKALAGTAYVFANNFNRNHVVRRIEMMKRPDSSPWRRSKVLYIVPLLAFSLVISATPVIEPLLFLDGEEISRERMNQLTKDSIDHIDVLTSPSATEIYGERAKGGAVIISSKSYKDATADVAERHSDDNEVFLIAEEMPEFVGGKKALKKYMQQHLNYPPEISEYGLQGRFDVSFIVEMDGSITNVVAKLINQMGEGPDAVIRTSKHEGKTEPNAENIGQIMQVWKSATEQVVAQMPRWKPARQQGRTVRAQVTIPLYYRLN